jgi:hypothetical protein
MIVERETPPLSAGDAQDRLGIDRRLSMLGGGMMISVESYRRFFLSSLTINPIELSTNSISWNSESLGVPVKSR